MTAAPQTTRGRAIAEMLRVSLAQLAELEKTAPSDVDAIVSALVTHLGGWRPETVSPLGTPDPTEAVRDPREQR